MRGKRLRSDPFERIGCARAYFSARYTARKRHQPNGAIRIAMPAAPNAHGTAHSDAQLFF